MTTPLLTRLVRAPLAHFLVLGGVLQLFAGARPAPVPPQAPKTIVLGWDDVERLRGVWADQYGVAPGPVEERRLVETTLDEEVLYRQALALGLDRGDPLVRERLVQLARFVDAGPVEDEDELERAARAAGLDRTDVVTRRYLVQAVRLLAAGPRAAHLPSEAAVTKYFDEHRDEFVEPPRQRMTQVYVSAERRGVTLERDAASLLERLRREHVVPAVAASLGDPFVRGADVPLEAVDALDRTFGPGFAEAVSAVPEGSWEGPVRSAYGLHLVWVHERVPAHVPAPAEVLGRVVLRMLREQRDARERAVVAGLRGQYDIRVEAEPPAE